MIRMLMSVWVTGIVALNAYADLNAGAATVDITASTGAAMAGYFTNRAATGTHDPLLARAIVLESKGTRIALVTCDLTNMPRGIVTAARERIQAATGIPASNIMISATHAHSAPVILSGWTRYRLEGEMLRIAEQYAAQLPDRIAAAVAAAAKQLTPARLFTAKGENATLAFNRRFHMKDGTVVWNPGKRNPNIISAAGPTDPSIPIVYLESTAGKPIAAYVNFAIHLDTVGGTEYSADLAYSLSESLKLARGTSFVTLFAMGCAGNVNHIDVTSARKQSGHAEAARIGITLAASVLKALDRMEEVTDFGLSAEGRTILLTAVRPTADDLAQASQSGNTLMLAKGARTREIEARQGKPFEAEVQVLRASGNVVWVGLPGEIFVELGLDLKGRSSATHTIIPTQTNGALGYIPNRAAYPQGAYEVLSARVEAGSGEALVEAALAALNHHHR